MVFSLYVLHVNTEINAWLGGEGHHLIYRGLYFLNWINYLFHLPSAIFYLFHIEAKYLFHFHDIYFCLQICIPNWA